MFLFRSKKSKQQERICDKEKVVSVEVAHHKGQTIKQTKQTKKVTDDFNRLLKKNGITLKIHIATWGHHGR